MEAKHYFFFSPQRMSTASFLVTRHKKPDIARRLRKKYKNTLCGKKGSKWVFLHLKKGLCEVSWWSDVVWTKSPKWLRDRDKKTKMPFGSSSTSNGFKKLWNFVRRLKKYYCMQFPLTFQIIWCLQKITAASLKALESSKRCETWQESQTQAKEGSCKVLEKSELKLKKFPKLQKPQPGYILAWWTTIPLWPIKKNSTCLFFATSRDTPPHLFLSILTYKYHSFPLILTRTGPIPTLSWLP